MRISQSRLVDSRFAAIRSPDFFLATRTALRLYRRADLAFARQPSGSLDRI
jgi:hypothetical protein